MKRLIACIILFVMFTASASALTANDLVWYHNEICGTLGAMKAGSGETDDSGWLFCSVTDYIILGYKVDAPTLIGGCTCDNEAELLEFLAQCATVCSVIGTQSNYNLHYGMILRQFLQARSGAETSMEEAGDLYINVKESNGLYQLVAMTKGF